MNSKLKPVGYVMRDFGFRSALHSWSVFTMKEKKTFGFGYQIHFYRLCFDK